MSVAENRQTILELLDSLPPLHKVAQELIALMSDDRASARDLDQLIRNDQALTARILKIANSSTYGKSREIFQLTEAVVLLGHGTLTNMVLSASVADVVNSKTDAEFSTRAWAHSLDCAALARTLAEMTGIADPEQAFVAGLLHDIGLLVQAQAVPEALFAVIAANPADPMTAEREAMGLNHAQIGLKLLDKWCLPPALCEAVRFHHAPDRKYLRTNPLVNIVALADRLTLVVGTAPYPNQDGMVLFQQLRGLAITPDRFEKLFAVLKQSREKTRCLLNAVHADSTPIPEAEHEMAEIAPLGLFAADPNRREWYAAVLEFLGFPVSRTSDDQMPSAVLVDFQGAAPEERAQVDKVARDQGMAPIVIGDRRRTPPGAYWQNAPHLPELFDRDQVFKCLESAIGAAVSPPRG